MKCNSRIDIDELELLNDSGVGEYLRPMEYYSWNDLRNIIYEMNLEIERLLDKLEDTQYEYDHLKEEFNEYKEYVDECYEQKLFRYED